MAKKISFMGIVPPLRKKPIIVKFVGKDGKLKSFKGVKCTTKPIKVNFMQQRKKNNLCKTCFFSFICESKGIKVKCDKYR